MTHSLPKNWRIVSLGECCKIVSGATPRRNVPEYWDNHIPWVTPKDISALDGPILEDTPEYISRAGHKSCSATLLPKGSVLFSSRAPIGLVALTGREMCTNQGFKSLVPGDTVHSEYLYHCMKWMAPRIAELGNGATFKEVSKEVISRVEIPLPPLEEQKRIAAILDKADAIRRKRQAAIKLADDFLRATFLDMFGDPVSNRSKYQTVQLRNITSRITYGFTCPMKHLKKGIPIITAKNVHMGSIDLHNVNFADKNQFEALTDKSKPQKGDILITKDGTIGRCSVFYLDHEVCINQSVALIKPDSSKIESSYLEGFLSTPPVQYKIKSMGKGNALQHLQITELAEYPIPLPSKNEQKRYVNLRNKIKELLSKQFWIGDEKSRLFNSLTQRAFRGEL